MDRTNVIGEKVKALRTAKEISLEELADRTGLAMEQITRIEENIDIPSLAPLVKLARALGVRLGTFLDDQTDETGPVICRKGEADDTISFSNNSLDSRQHMHYHSLSRSKTDRHMEPFIIDIDANENYEFNLSAHEGEEFIMVLKGALEIKYGKYTYLLEEGDTIYYDSIVPHHVHSFEGQAARILAVIYTHPSKQERLCYSYRKEPLATGWNTGQPRRRTRNTSFIRTATCALRGGNSTAV